MKQSEFLSVAENKEAVREITTRILERVKPDEVKVSNGFFKPLFEMSASNKMPRIGGSDKPGQHFDPDLMVIVVYPIVVNVLSNLITNPVKSLSDNIKSKIRGKGDKENKTDKPEGGDKEDHSEFDKSLENTTRRLATEIKPSITEEDIRRIIKALNTLSSSMC